MSTLQQFETKPLNPCDDRCLVGVGSVGNLTLAGNGPPLPTIGVVGDLYFDLSTGDVYRREVTGWELVGSTCCDIIPKAGLRHFVQPDEPLPEGLEIGDFWTDANNNLHYWNGVEWIPYGDLDAFVRWEAVTTLGPNQIQLDLVNSVPSLPQPLTFELSQLGMNYEYQVNLTVSLPDPETGIPVPGLTPVLTTDGIIVPPLVGVVAGPIEVFTTLNYQFELAGPIKIELSYDEIVGDTVPQTKYFDVVTKKVYRASQALTVGGIVNENGEVTLTVPATDLGPVVGDTPFMLQITSILPGEYFIQIIPNPDFDGIKALGELTNLDLFDNAGANVQISNVSIRWFFPNITFRLLSSLGSELVATGGVDPVTLSIPALSLVTLDSTSLLLTGLVWSAGTGDIFNDIPADDSYFNSESPTLPAIPGFHELELYLLNYRANDMVRSEKPKNYKLLSDKKSSKLAPKTRQLSNLAKPTIYKKKTVPTKRTVAKNSSNVTRGGSKKIMLGHPKKKTSTTNRHK